MQIIVDSREQLPLEFTVPTIRECLPCGDYRAKFSDGSLSEVVVERKSLGDAYGTLSQGYDRFRREMQLAEELGITLIIVIEASLRRVLSGYSNSRRTGLSIVYQLFTIRVRHNVHTVFCTNRDEASQYIMHLFKALEDNHNDTKSPEVRKPLS